VVRVVSVVPAEFRIDDQGDGPGAEVVAGVHQPPSLAELEQRRRDLRTRYRERRQVKDAAEVSRPRFVLARLVLTGAGWTRRNHGDDDNQHQDSLSST
jgi:hypothetical protein